MDVDDDIERDYHHLEEIEEYDNERMEFFEKDDLFLISCSQSVIKATAYLTHLFNKYKITDVEYEQFVRNFYGLTYRDVHSRPIEQSAGGLDDIHDMRIYNLLLHADTCHDFFDPEEEEKDAYFNDFDIDIPTNIDITNTTDFINKISSKKILTFKTGDNVQNPLYNANVLDKFKIDMSADLSSPEAIEEVFEKQQRSIRGKIGAKQTMIPVDIWTNSTLVHNQHDENFERVFEIIKLNHIAQLCAVFRNCLGPRREVQIDNSDNQLVKLFFATKHVSEAILKHITLHPPKSSIADVQLITNVLNWTAYTTDANLFDATTNVTQLEIDNRPTGPIYRKELSYQITLQGIQVDSINRKSVSTIFTDNGKMTTQRITNRESTNRFSTNSIRVIVSVDNGSHFTSTFSKQLKYAIKRAGDWGQVEHCKKYGKIFITSDRLAALYAKYRGVQFIYLSRKLADNYKWYRYTFMVGLYTFESLKRP